MQSLRTRRPSDGARPRQGAGAGAPRQPGQGKLSKSPSSAGLRQQAGRSTRSMRKSRVDDKIKKRMSMRYADISGPTLAGGAVPAVPALPIGAYAGAGGLGVGVGAGRRGAGAGAQYEDAYGYGMDEEGVRTGRAARPDVREADLRGLESEAFDPDACELHILL